MASANSKVPKAVTAVREKLQNAGVPITPENLKEHLDSKDLNLVASCFRTKLNAAGHRVSSRRVITDLDISCKHALGN